MKKLVLSVFSAFMLLTLATPIHALGSVSHDGVINVDGLEKGEDFVLSKAEDADNPGLLEEVEKTGDVSKLGITDTEVKLATTFKKFEVVKSTKSAGPYLVTWEVQGIPSGAAVYALMSNDGGVTWKLAPASLSGNNITLTLNNGSLFAVAFKAGKAPVANNDKPASKPASGYDDGGPFTTDACGNVFDRWGNEVYHAPVCVNNNAAAGNDYTFVNTSDR